MLREQVGEGFKITLQLKLPEGFDNRWLERQFVKVLVMEQILSGAAAVNLFAQLPPGLDTESGPGLEIARQVVERTEVAHWLTTNSAKVCESPWEG